MRAKGSKFARKHAFNEDEKIKKLSPLSPEFEDFFNNHYSFTKRFLKLSYNEQIKLISELYNISGISDDSYADLSAFYIQKIHELTDSDYEEGVYEPVAIDEKRLIRMDCHGSINCRRIDQLSDLYRYFNSHHGSKKYLLREYDLETSPNWKVMAQFESFRSIAPKIKHALYKMQINPDALKIMTINDFCDVIYKKFSDGSEKAHFIPGQASIKSRYIKQFMKECGDSFSRTLLEKGLDERCIKALCNQMKRFGSCNLDTLVITETHYTERTLKNLKKAGFDTKNLTVGMPIPEDFINYLIDNKKEQLILARNNDGSLPDKYSLPRLELHHNHAVKFADAGYLASSNYPDRFVLVEAKMHRGYYHLFDSLIKQNDMQNYFSRLDISNRYTRMRIGFATSDALYGDFENNQAFYKRAAEDKKYRVNYFECQEEYAKNVEDIVEKYNIEIMNYGSKRTQDLAQNIKTFKKFTPSAKIKHYRKNGKKTER